jgi:hypothetical protein
VSYNKALPSPFPMVTAEEIPSCCHGLYIPIRLPQRPVASLVNSAGLIARYENNAVPALLTPPWIRRAYPGKACWYNFAKLYNKHYILKEK